MKRIFTREQNSSWLSVLPQLLSVVWRIFVLHNKSLNKSTIEILMLGVNHPCGRWNDLLSLTTSTHTSLKPLLVHYLKCIPLKSRAFESAIKKQTPFSAATYQAINC